MKTRCNVALLLTLLVVACDGGTATPDAGSRAGDDAATPVMDSSVNADGSTTGDHDGSVVPGTDAGSEPPAMRPSLGAMRSVHRVDDARITQALDMIVSGGDVIACFGSWRSVSGWDAHCRNLRSGSEDHGSADHETAGVGLALNGSGALVGFEADRARRTGGPGIFGGGIRHNDGAHFWQSISVGGGFAIAAAARIEGWNADVFIGEANGDGPWTLLASQGRGVPHRQTFIDPYHLIFTTRYMDAGSPRLMRVDTSRNITELAYSGLPSGCEGVATAEFVEGVGLVAGTYSDQLPWRGGDCAHVGLLDHETGATSNWRALGGADVVDIVDLGEGYFALSAALPPRVMILSPEFETVQEVALPGAQAGGLAVHEGELYAASAQHGWAEVYAFPLGELPTDPEPEPPPVAAATMHFNLVLRQTLQSCGGCGIWFDPQGVAARRPRLVVRYSVAGAEQTREFQRGMSHELFGYFIAPPSEAGPRASHEDALLVKQGPARTGLLFSDLSSIPEGAEILEARLYMHIHVREGLANSDRTSVLTVYEGMHEWDFATVNWNQWRPGLAWTSAGGDSGPVVREIRADRDLWGRGFSKANPDANFDFTAYVTELQRAR